jgi:hypothetical protein
MANNGCQRANAKKSIYQVLITGWKILIILTIDVPETYTKDTIFVSKYNFEHACLYSNYPRLQKKILSFFLIFEKFF